MTSLASSKAEIFPSRLHSCDIFSVIEWKTISIFYASSKSYFVHSTNKNIIYARMDYLITITKELSIISQSLTVTIKDLGNIFPSILYYLIQINLHSKLTTGQAFGPPIKLPVGISSSHIKVLGFKSKFHSPFQFLLMQTLEARTMAHVSHTHMWVWDRVLGPWPWYG